jgi:hypothetical protein
MLLFLMLLQSITLISCSEKKWFSANDVKISESYAYVVFHGDKESHQGTGRLGVLRIYNVTDPLNPKHIGRCKTNGSAWRIHLKDEYAFVATGRGLESIDISDPINPIPVDFYEIKGATEDVFISGNQAYVTCCNPGLLIINISDPENMTLAGSSNIPLKGSGVHVNGTLAYVGGSHDLVILDVSDASNISLLASASVAYPMYLFVHGNNAYIPSGHEGISIFDISEPSSPIRIRLMNNSDFARSIYVSGTYAYVADGCAGLLKIDVSDPANPAIIKTYDTPGRTNSVFVKDSYAYLADGKKGLQVVKID